MNNRLRKGRLVATALAQSWRSENSPRALSLSTNELDEVTPLLYGSGAGALGWWRVRETELASTSSGEVLHQAYRLQALQTAIHEQKLEKVFRLLREAGVEPLLAKGWAAARFYPDAALRPYGDFDLLVRPEKFRIANEVLQSEEAADCWVDLHSSFSEIGDRSVEDLFGRSRTLIVGDEEVRVLGDEDHLALLCIHLLKHGAWRPLWLCDVGAIVESASPNFAWDLCLGTSSRRADWISCAIGLAHRLLGAELNAKSRLTKEAGNLPQWLVESVLKQWASPFAINQPPMSHSAPMGSYWKRPWGLAKAMRERWPNPILATISVNGQFNELPRLPYQMGNCAMRAGQFLIDLPGRLRSH